MTVTIEFTPDEVAALAAALEAFSVDPPVVPDVAVYLAASEKIVEAAGRADVGRMSDAARKLAEDALAWFDNDPSAPDVDARGIELARELLAALDREAAGSPDVRLAACDEAFRKQFDRAEAAEKALRKIAAEPMRFHPIAGYQFEIDVRKLAREALAVLGVSGRPVTPQERR